MTQKKQRASLARAIRGLGIEFGRARKLARWILADSPRLRDAEEISCGFNPIQHPDFPDAGWMDWNVIGPKGSMEIYPGSAWTVRRF